MIKSIAIDYPNGVPLDTMYEKRESISISDFGPSLAKQSFKDECDINNIMAKYEKSGLITHVNNFDAFYGDVSSLPDYHGAFEVVRLADASFISLPADLRSRFDNDPSKYLDFVMDPKNRDEMIKLGMIEVKATVAPVVPAVVPAVDK